MKYYLYILQTIVDTLYCGITNDVKKRYKAHIEGSGAKYTKSHRPKAILYLKEYEDKSSAMKEEYRIKHSLTRTQKLKLIKENELETEKLLSEMNL